VICTGSNLSNEIKHSFQESFGIDILNYYGLTETTGICITQLAGAEIHDYSTIGRPVNCVAQVVDENGQIQDPNNDGELRLFGNNIIQGYYQQPELTEKVIRNGWFYTGDIARITSNGEVTLRGRKKEIIKTADGLQVYTAEVELILENHPSVKEAAVLPKIEDEKEKMVAFVVLLSESDSADDKISLNAYIKRHIGDRNIPVEIFLVNRLPRNANGKLLKADMFESMNNLNYSN